MSDKGQMCFYWPEKKHISEKTEVFDLDGDHEKIAYERIRVEQMSDTTSMIAVGREPKRKMFFECGTWFIIRPSHSSREFSIFAEERRATNHAIKFMEFVSNNHIITRFKGDKIKGSTKKEKDNTVVFRFNGEIKNQKEDIQKYLECEIVGQSDLHYQKPLSDEELLA